VAMVVVSPAVIPTAALADASAVPDKTRSDGPIQRENRVESSIFSFSTCSLLRRDFVALISRRVRVASA
jgi:hypothetical protein